MTPARSTRARIVRDHAGGAPGRGKTTTAGKLALRLRKNGRRPLLVPADLRRAAAVEQLRVVGGQVEVPVFDSQGQDPLAIARAAVERARRDRLSPVIIDTAGRTHVDQELMAEIAAMKQTLSPREVLLVLDAMTGQDAVNVASEFDKAVGITGRDPHQARRRRPRRGRPVRACRHRQAHQAPGVGEKLDALEVFHPDRMASRILGMGDVLTLIEQAEAAMEEKEAAELEKRLRQRQFDLNDFMRELQRLTKMGPLENLLGMIPGMQAFASVCRLRWTRSRWVGWRRSSNP